MNIKHVLFGVLILQLLAGCAAIQKGLSPTEMYVERDNIRISMPGDNPPGEYTLETVLGEVVAKAKYQQNFTSNNKIAKGVFWFHVQYRIMSVATASSCMQIRKPDNTLLPVRAGMLSSSTKFKIPVMEYSVLKYNAIPAVNRDISLIKSYQKNREQLQQKLAAQPIYKNGQCVAPDPGPKPPGVCLNRAEANQMSEDRCFDSNFKCTIGSTALIPLLSGNPPDTEDEFQDFLTKFSQNACSVAVDKAYNEPADLWAMGRSILVGLAVEAIYKKLVTDNPDLSDKVIIDAMAGVINYQFCLNDAYDSCSRKRDIWLSSSNKRLSQCLQLKRQYDDVEFRLKLNEHFLEGLEMKLKDYQNREQEIMQSGTRRGNSWWLNQGADGC